MKKYIMLVMLVLMTIIFVGCSTTRSLSAPAEPEPTVAELNQKVNELKARIIVLELESKMRAARRASMTNSLNRVRQEQRRVRSKSKLIIQPKVEQGMNLLGERFPVKEYQLRQNNLKKLKFSKPAKPIMVKPLAPDSRAVPPPAKSKEETSINEAEAKK